MKEITKQLSKKILSSDYVDERLEMLKDKYKDETVYIIAAGPSLNNYKIEELKQKLDDKLVFCIKQSYDIYRDICDFMFVNFCNISPFDYKNETIVSWAYWFDQHPMAIQQNGWKADLLFPVTRNQSHDTLGRYGNSIASKGDWNNIRFEASLERPWGPGLMYELAVPLAIHLGVKRIVTIGWDIGDINKWKDSNDPTERHYLDHCYSNEKTIYEKFSVDAAEMKLIASSVEHMYEYLKSIGVEFNIMSDQNPASDVVPRIKFSEL